MKILLIGEYSSLHWNLAQGLRSLGHSVTVASDGDGFKNYPRDIDFGLNGNSFGNKIRCISSILKNLNRLKGFDVVQIINPCFTRIHRINIHLYRFLRRHNKKVFLGAFGDDYFYVKMCLENRKLRYSEFFINGIPHNMQSNEDLKDAWLNTYRGRDNIEIADSCDGIVACLYEYYVAYEDAYKGKLTYIPLPINMEEIKAKKIEDTPSTIKFFIGINKGRLETKGSDLLYEALREVTSKYPNETEIIKVESVPYSEYVELLNNSHIVLDQAYSYSPAMNGLLALATGKILVGGGEPEMYDLLRETHNHPILNIEPTIESISSQLEFIIKNKEEITSRSASGRKLAEDHFDHIKVAQKYIDFWSN